MLLQLLAIHDSNLALAVRVCFVLGNLTVSNDDNRQRIGLEFSGTSIALSVLDLAVYRDARLATKLKKLIASAPVSAMGRTGSGADANSSSSKAAMGAIVEEDEEEDGDDEAGDGRDRGRKNAEDEDVQYVDVDAEGDDPDDDEDDYETGDRKADSVEQQQKRFKQRAQIEAQFKENEDLLVKVGATSFCARVVCTSCPSPPNTWSCRSDIKVDRTNFVSHT
jgi:hypothetical protein